MARRPVGDLDRLLDAWALWCDSGRPVLASGGRSLLARWMDGKGQVLFGGGSGGVDLVACREADVEAAVVALFQVEPLAADVLRLEYLAGWREVVARRQLGAYEPRGLKQLDRALRLGVSVRTYRTRLGEARAHVLALIGGKTK